MRQVKPATPPTPRARPLPRVPVVVPAYNYAHFLPGCLDSVVSQRGVDVDVVVVNDASTDDTADVVAGRAAADPRIRLIDRRENRGLGATVNEGMAAVDGEFVVKLDADDLLTPGSLARATALMRAEPDVAFVTGRPLHFTGAVPDGPGTRAPSWTIWSGHDWIEAHCRTGYNSISNPEVVARRSVVEATDGRNLQLPATEDFEMWLQMATRGDVGRINGPAQAYYRVHADSMLRTMHAGPIIDLKGRIGAFESALGGDAKSRLPDAVDLLYVARRTIAGQALDCACRACTSGVAPTRCRWTSWSSWPGRSSRRPVSSRSGGRSSGDDGSGSAVRPTCRRSWRGRWPAAPVRSCSDGGGSAPACSEGSGPPP